MNKEEYENLVKLIDYHMDRYYNQDEPEISDYEYDRLMLQLKMAEREHPDWITADSPTQKIGGEAQSEAGEQIAHRIPMLSIEDVFTKEDIIDWVSRAHKKHPDALFSVEVKVDGVSLSLRYRKREQDGKMELFMAETRGTGYVGGNVLSNALAISDIQKKLDLPYDYLELRGEVYVTRDNFCRYNRAQQAAGGKTEENPRNLAAASLRQLDAKNVRECGLQMLIFNIQDGPAEMMTSHTSGMKRIEALGVSTVYHKLCTSAEEVVTVIDEIDRMRERLPYDIDGAVVKLDQIGYRDDFPAGPKYSAGHIAYKYPPKEG